MNMVELRVTTTGSSGAASGSAATPQAISGRIIAVVLDYHASAHANTQVELYMTTTPVFKILDYDTHNTDITLYPRKQASLNEGTLLTYDGTYKVTEPYAVHGELTMAVALSNALTDCVTAYIFYE